MTSQVVETSTKFPKVTGSNPYLSSFVIPAHNHRFRAAQMQQNSFCISHVTLQTNLRVVLRLVLSFLEENVFLDFSAYKSNRVPSIISGPMYFSNCLLPKEKKIKSSVVSHPDPLAERATANSKKPND